MTISKRFSIPVLAFFFILCSLISARASDTIYQYSTIDSLLIGNYDGELTAQELKKHGDTGLGTFNTLDGEMVFIDGTVYKVGADGKAVQVPQTQRSPFATSVFFKTDSIVKIDTVSSLNGLNDKIRKALSSENIFYAIKIQGKFNSIKTRSVPAQKKPYPPLVEVVKDQSIFKFKNVKGTLVGIKSPAYVKGMGVPGFHWHFITEDRKAGGHVLDCTFKNLPAKIGEYSNLYLQLPRTSSFLDADLNKDKEKELKKVEKNPEKD